MSGGRNGRSGLLQRMTLKIRTSVHTFNRLKAVRSGQLPFLDSIVRG
jgi:hypothetical protein